MKVRQGSFEPHPSNLPTSVALSHHLLLDLTHLTGWNAEGDPSFDGLLADVRLYEGLLSSSEVQALASTKVVAAGSCSQPVAPDLQAWYPFKHNVKDASGNGYDGSLVNAGSSSSSSLACGYLDLSSSSYVDLGSTSFGTSVVAQLSSFSLAVWIKVKEYAPYSR